MYFKVTQIERNCHNLINLQMQSDRKQTLLVKAIAHLEKKSLIYYNS